MQSKQKHPQICTFKPYCPDIFVQSFYKFHI